MPNAARFRGNVRPRRAGSMPLIVGYVTTPSIDQFQEAMNEKHISGQKNKKKKFIHLKTCLL